MDGRKCGLEVRGACLQQCALGLVQHNAGMSKSTRPQVLCMAKRKRGTVDGEAQASHLGHMLLSSVARKAQRNQPQQSQQHSHRVCFLIEPGGVRPLAVWIRALRPDPSRG
eukprot:15464892-Alexandrium_andersonii.AAC.2